MHRGTGLMTGRVAPEVPARELMGADYDNIVRLEETELPQYDSAIIRPRFQYPAGKKELFREFPGPLPPMNQSTA
jgi:hypothetical protein